MNDDYSTKVVHQAQLETLNKDKHPEYFTSGSFASFMAQKSGDGSTSLFTIKDAKQYNLVDNVSSYTAKFLSFYLKKCDNETSAVQCADFGDNDELLIDYLANFQFVLQEATNFIDYENIEPHVGPLQQGNDFLDALVLN